MVEIPLCQLEELIEAAEEILERSDGSAWNSYSWRTSPRIDLARRAENALSDVRMELWRQEQ